MRRLNIVVAGYVIGCPLGGQTWTRLHYLLGLHKLGHNVIYYEDSGDWGYPYDPDRETSDADSSYGRAHLSRVLAPLGLSGRWAYYSQFEDRLYGLQKDELHEFCRKADVFLNISGVTPLRRMFCDIPRRIFIDTDPVYNQVKIEENAEFKDHVFGHTHFFTYGINLLKGQDKVYMNGLPWRPIVPPVVLDNWNPRRKTRDCFTTIGSWTSKEREVVIRNRTYRWCKKFEFRKYLGLPGKSRSSQIELAMSGMADDEMALFRSNAWSVLDALHVSKDHLVYNEYIRTSKGEFSIAKEQYAALETGWFSDRSACYLAAGRPVILQDTAFGDYLPVGEGLFAFRDVEQARECMDRVDGDYARHRLGARRIAEETFDSRTVLGGMLDTAWRN